MLTEPAGSVHAARPHPTRAAGELGALRRFASLLDARYRIPGIGVRFGVDSLLGLVPGIGDVLGIGLSSIVIWRARKLGVRHRTLARMIGNVVLDGLAGAVPIAGDLFDVWFHANERNVRLLEHDLQRRRTSVPVRGEPGLRGPSRPSGQAR